MNPDEEQHLSDLLQQATESPTIINDCTKEQIHPRRFRADLIEQWSRFVPDHSLYHPSHCTVTVRDESVKHQLLYSISSALQEHTREGKIQTAATKIVGGYFPGYTVADLAERMVKVAIGKGPESTAQAFCRDLHEQVATFR